MFQRWLHSSCRVARLAALLGLLASTAGCTLWDGDRWSPDRYRDERAVDIERHLERAEPIVKNPF